MNRRREFIRQMLIAGAGVTLLPEFLRAQQQSANQVRILHTGNINSGLPLGKCGNPSLNELQKLATMIYDERVKDPSLLVFDTGGVFRSIPGFHHFGGVPEIQMMNHAGYRATTPGIHDFDNGIDKLAELMKHADFHMVNCNYMIRHKALADRTLPFSIFQTASLKIGVTGVGADLKKRTRPEIYNEIKFKDPATCLNSVSNHLVNKESCDLVIALSHLGFEENLALAATSENTNAILGATLSGKLHHQTSVKNTFGLLVRVSTTGCSVPGNLNLNI